MKIWEMLINWKIKRDKQKHQLSEELLEELSEMVDKRRAELLACPIILSFPSKIQKCQFQEHLDILRQTPAYFPVLQKLILFFFIEKSF